MADILEDSEPENIEEGSNRGKAEDLLEKFFRDDERRRIEHSERLDYYWTSVLNDMARDYGISLGSLKPNHFVELSKVDRKSIRSSVLLVANSLEQQRNRTQALNFFFISLNVGICVLETCLALVGSVISPWLPITMAITAGIAFLSMKLCNQWTQRLLDNTLRLRANTFICMVFEQFSDTKSFGPEHQLLTTETARQMEFRDHALAVSFQKLQKAIAIVAAILMAFSVLKRN